MSLDCILLPVGSLNEIGQIYVRTSGEHVINIVIKTSCAIILLTAFGCLKTTAAHPKYGSDDI
jgi:hypothetical protein